MLFLDQWKRKNGGRYSFMTKFSQNNVPDVLVDLSVACISKDLVTDQATTTGKFWMQEIEIILPRQ